MRSAQVMEGYKLMFDDSIVTVWSAPNYCYRCVAMRVCVTPRLMLIRCGNVASVLELDDNLKQEYKVFDAAPQVRVLLCATDTLC